MLWVHHEERSECLTDYKFFCFNGQARFMYISKDIGTNPTTDFFDMDFNHMEIRMKDPNSGVLPEKPECFDHMRKLAEKLSCGFPHVRADFYYINHRIYFGELTFYHCSGFAQIHPNGIDRKIGDFVCLDHI